MSTKPRHAAAAAGLTGEQRQQAETAYLDGFTTAVTDTVAAACRRTLSRPATTATSPT